MVSKSLEEVRSWKNTVYEEDKNLGMQEQIDKTNTIANEILKKYNVKVHCENINRLSA